MATKKLKVNLIITDDRWKKIGESKVIAKEVIHAALPFVPDLISSHAVNVILSEDKQVQQLNKQFRGVNKPTNVLSFSVASEAYAQSELGDIILSYDTIEKEAEGQGKHFLDHYQHLVLHGFLHLLDYDHQEEEAANEMESLEIRILKTLGKKNPYQDNYQ